MRFQYINPNHTLRIYRKTANARLVEAKKWRSRSPHWWPLGPTGPYKFRFDAGSEYRNFYLDSDFMPSLRWEWADEMNRNIRHTGWFTDEHGMADTIRGIVFRLPRGRGLLAGWSMGENMATELSTYVWDADDETSASNAADAMAEATAEREREYQAELEDEDDE